MLSERWSSWSKPISQESRNARVTPSQTPHTTTGCAWARPKMPASSPPTKQAPPSTKALAAMMAARTAARPWLRVHWLRVSRQRSQRMVLSWDQFTSCLQPTELVRLVAVVADDSEELLFRSTGAAQVLHGAVMHQLAAGDDADVGAEFLHNLQDVGGEKDRCAATDALLEGVAQHARGNGIDALEGFVEEQEVWIGDQGSGQGELLLHTVGELEREFLFLVRQIHHVQQFVATRADGSRRQKIHAADEGKVFAGGQIRSEERR